MSQYAVLNDEVQDARFDIYAEEYALYLCSCRRDGAEILLASSAEDYDRDPYEAPVHQTAGVSDRYTSYEEGIIGIGDF